jgi:hypothetical protein
LAGRRGGGIRMVKSSHETHIDRLKKKKYKKPRLVLYGDIRVITKAIMSSGANTDANPSGMLKTA